MRQLVVELCMAFEVIKRMMDLPYSETRDHEHFLVETLHDCPLLLRDYEGRFGCCEENRL